MHFQQLFVVPDILTVGLLFRANSMGNVSYLGPAAFTEEFVAGGQQVRCDNTPSYCAHHDQDRGALSRWPWTYRCVLPNMQTTVFCLLKTDLIHIFMQVCCRRSLSASSWWVSIAMTISSLVCTHVFQRIDVYVPHMHHELCWSDPPHTPMHPLHRCRELQQPTWMCPKGSQKVPPWWCRHHWHCCPQP